MVIVQVGEKGSKSSYEFRCPEASLTITNAQDQPARYPSSDPRSLIRMELDEAPKLDGTCLIQVSMEKYDHYILDSLMIPTAP